MKRYYLLIVMIIVCAHTQAQTYGHDDLSQYLTPLNEKRLLADPIDRDTQVIWQFNYIAEELARTQDPRTDAYIDTLKFIADTSNWKSAQAFYHRAVARQHDFKGEFAPALESYTKAIEIYKTAHGRLQELAFTYVLKGFLLSNAELYEEAREVLNEGLPYARRAKGKNPLCLILDWFGDIEYYGLQGEKNNEKALEYYLQVQEILPQINYSRIIADNYAVISGIYGRTGKKKLAAEYFVIADSLATKFNLPYVRWGLYAEKARLLEEKGDHLGANKIYVKTKDFFKGNTDVRFKSRLEKALWENYKNIGDYKNSLIHYENLTEMNKTMDVAKLEEKIVEIEAKYDVALKEKEVAQLQREKSTINRNFLLGLLGLTLVGGIIIYNKNRALSKSYVALEKKQEEVEQAQYHGETQERKRIASELHDNVNTKLAAARWRLEAISDEVQNPAKEIVESTINMMNEAYQDVRNISHNLVPAHLTEKGLVGSIQNLLEKLNDSAPIKFQLESNNIEEDRIRKIAYPLYNIIFELINNVMKHADATNSIVTLEVHDQTLSAKVSDNGKGFNPEKIKAGFGSRSIRSRVQSLNGNLEIISSAGKGTTMVVKIPLKK